MIRLLCMACNEVSTFDTLEGVSCCPNCKDSHHVPADMADTVAVNITWHELRILVIWAERWVSHCEDRQSMQKTLYGIADRLQMQHMNKSPGLTFMSEISELQAKFGNVQQNVVKEGPNG